MMIMFIHLQREEEKLVETNSLHIFLLMVYKQKTVSQEVQLMYSACFTLFH